MLWQLIKKIRRQHYVDLIITQNNPMQALWFLRHQLTPIYHRENPKEKAELNRLIRMLFEDYSIVGINNIIPAITALTLNTDKIITTQNKTYKSHKELFCSSSSSQPKSSMDIDNGKNKNCSLSLSKLASMTRSNTFDKLMNYFPPEMTQPTDHIDIFKQKQ